MEGAAVDSNVSLDVESPELIPDPSLDRDIQVAQQRTVAQRARFEAPTTPDVPTRSDGVIVGVDQAFSEDEAVSAAIALHNGEIVDRAIARRQIRMPYVPGLLVYREGEAVVGALSALDVDPAVIMCDGSGRIHFRQAGLATHMGVLFDVPSIGITKSLLCGTPDSGLPDRLKEGRRIPIMADDDVEAVSTKDADWPRIGCAYQSRQFRQEAAQSINPLYVSPGHRMDVTKAVDLVAATCDEYKLPEPTRLADRAARQAKEKG